MEQKKVSCLGPEGSFSERAAALLCEGYEIVLCRTFAEAAGKLINKEADYVVLPVENALNGAVLPVLDLLSSHELFGEEEGVVDVDLRLALREGVKREDITEICSHEQVLGQCAEYLREHFPSARLSGVSSTSESLNRLDFHTAGVVGAHVKREGVSLSEENIADDKRNFTKFLRVRRGSADERVHGAMVFVCAICAHRPGSLLGLLKIFQREELNLTRIESRPVKGQFGQYRFFIEFTGDIASERVQRAIREAEKYCTQFRVLASYR